MNAVPGRSPRHCCRAARRLGLGQCLARPLASTVVTHGHTLPLPYPRPPRDHMSASFWVSRGERPRGRKPSCVTSPASRLPRPGTTPARCSSKTSTTQRLLRPGGRHGRGRGPDARAVPADAVGPRAAGRARGRGPDAAASGTRRGGRASGELPPSPVVLSAALNNAAELLLNSMPIDQVPSPPVRPPPRRPSRRRSRRVAASPPPCRRPRPRPPGGNWLLLPCRTHRRLAHDASHALQPSAPFGAPWQA